MARIYAVQTTSGEEDGSLSRQRWVWRELVAYVFPYEWRQLGRLHLSPAQWRLWCGLLGRCGWRNECRTTQAQLAQDTGLTAAQVCRAVQRLVASQLILPLHDEGGRPCGWVLDPALVWRGRPWGRRYARECYQALARLQAHAPALPLPPSAEASTPPDGTNLWHTQPFPDYGPITEVTPV